MPMGNTDIYDIEPIPLNAISHVMTERVKMVRRADMSLDTAKVQLRARQNR